jgi:hypothetical protein
VSSKAIMSPLEEAKGAPQGPALDKMKKPELAERPERAQRVIAGTGWLPSLLRVDGRAASDHDAEVLPEAAE